MSSNEACLPRNHDYVVQIADLIIFCGMYVGFVRFHSPKAVQKALEQFRVSEIEVQDVSVMIKSLKADAPML